VPKQVNAFKAVGVEFIPVIRLPSDAKEPAIARLNWSDDLKEKYNMFIYEFDGAYDALLGYPPRHHLLGYAHIEQEFCDAVADEDWMLLFQLGSDVKTMCWGDGGYLYFWIHRQDLARRDFTAIFTDYQCG
jgi:uncharacterized protein YwqG